MDPASTCLNCTHFGSYDALSLSLCSPTRRRSLRCSGCTHEFYLDKPPVLQEVTDFFSAHGIEDFTFSRGRLSEWRCRAKLAVRGTPEKPLIGLYQEGTHIVQDIPECRAHHPSINYAIKLLKQGISELGVQPFDEDAGTGELRYVQMTVTTYNTSIPVAQRYEQARVQVSLVWNSRDERSKNSEKLSLLQEFLWTNGGPRSNLHVIHSIWANFQTSTSNIIFGHKWRHIGGEADLWERFGGVDICLDPYSFGQANTLSFNSLLHKLIKYVPRGSTVVDLYSGAGVIGLAIAASRKCRPLSQVYETACLACSTKPQVVISKLVWVWPENAKFEPGLAREKSPNITVFWPKAGQSLRNQEPIHWLEGSSVAIVDPPRKGLHPSVINALQRVALSERKAFKAKSSLTKVKDEKRPWILRAREPAVHVDSTIMEESSGIWPETLIYISCGWDSFKKDCKSLISNEAWHLENAHAFNFFPGTDSIEVLAIFRRDSGIAQKKTKTKTKTKAKAKAKTKAKKKKAKPSKV
uniref:Methyltransferase small domain-containing protein n=1 Tax=Aegilops tauschii TaxID=37682 RepID=M8C8E9_AEGTA